MATYPGTLSGIDDESSSSNYSDNPSGTNAQPSGMNASGLNEDLPPVRMERRDEGPADKRSSSNMTSKDNLRTHEHSSECSALKTRGGRETELRELPLNKEDKMDSKAAAAAAAEDASGAVGVSSPSSQFDSSCSTMDSPCLNCSQVFEEAKTNCREDICQPIDEKAEVRFSTVRVVSSSAVLLVEIMKVTSMIT